LDGEVREQVEELLTTGLESPDPARRKLAAEVKLARRLKQFQRIDDTTEIDTDFITCAEYQLFLDEMYDQERHYQPDHWTAYTFFETTPKLSATASALGVSAKKSAEAFVIWLNEREKATYRLPTPTEAKEFPANMESVATWCYENEKYTLDGLSKLEYQQIEHRLKKLSTLPLLEHWISLFLSFSNSSLLDLDLDPALYFRRALDISRATIAFDLDRSLALDFNHALVTRHTRHTTISHHTHVARYTINLDRSLDRDRDHALALDLAETIDRELYTLLNARQFDAALSKIRQLQKNDSPSIAQQRRLTLLIDLIHCQTATTPSGIRQAFRKYVIHLLENVWIGLNESEKEKTEEIVIRPWWQLWWQFWKQPSPKVEQTDYLEVEQTDYSEKEQNILELYWRLKITEAREAGELPAWEGIRLVRVTAET